MSYFTLKNQPLTVDKVVDDLMTELNAERATVFNPDVATAVLTHESFEKMDSNATMLIEAAEKTIDDSLERSKLRDLLEMKLGYENATEAQRKVINRQIEKGLEAATLVLLGGGAPSAHADANVAQGAFNGAEGVTTIGHTAPVEITHESFEKQEFGEWIGFSAVAAALSTATNPVANLFYNTVVLPANKPGISMPVMVPHVYNPKNRSLNGGKYELIKRPIVHAMVDHTVLLSRSNEVHPYAPADGKNDAYLVAANDQRPTNEVIAGATIPTRHLKLGEMVDLIAISGHPALLKGEMQDETDTLAPAVQVKSFLVNIGNGTANAGLVLDVAGKPGTMFFPQLEGNVEHTILAFNGTAIASNDTVLEDGQTLEDALSFGATDLGLVAGSKYHLEIGIEASGLQQNDLANAKVSVNELTLANIYTYNAENKAVAMDHASAEFKAVAAKLALVGKGWYPLANRTDSNMRDTSLVCEMGNTYNYVIPVRPGAPMTTISPMQGQGGAATMDAVAMNIRALVAGQAITELLRFENQLAVARNLPASTTAVGGRVVVPTYIHRKVDLPTLVTVNTSVEAMTAMRNHLVDAVTMVANELIVRSRYLAALEVYTGSSSNFEVIVGTDPHIGAHLMVSGDGRTIGNDRKFTISTAQDQRLDGRIYISLRRTDVDGANMLNFGVFGTSPSMLYSAQTTKNGRVAKEMHMIPRNVFAVTLPVLGRIDVIGMDKFFSTEA